MCRALAYVGARSCLKLCRPQPSKCCLLTFFFELCSAGSRYSSQGRSFTIRSRNDPQKHPKRDDDAFSIRIKLAVPGDGLGTTLDDMMTWLLAELPRDTFAVHSARTIGGSAMVVYFLGIEDAGRFLAAFPTVPLATPARR